LYLTASLALLVLAHSATSIVNASSPFVAIFGWIGAVLGLASLVVLGIGLASESGRS
jgi:hypothetical protein